MPTQLSLNFWTRTGPPLGQSKTPPAHQGLHEHSPVCCPTTGECRLRPLGQPLGAASEPSRRAKQNLHCTGKPTGKAKHCGVRVAMFIARCTLCAHLSHFHWALTGNLHTPEADTRELRGPLGTDSRVLVTLRKASHWVTRDLLQAHAVGGSTHRVTHRATHRVTHTDTDTDTEL